MNQQEQREARERRRQEQRDLHNAHHGDGYSNAQRAFMARMSGRPVEGDVVAHPNGPGASAHDPVRGFTEARVRFLLDERLASRELETLSMSEREKDEEVVRLRKQLQRIESGGWDDADQELSDTAFHAAHGHPDTPSYANRPGDELGYVDRQEAGYSLGGPGANTPEKAAWLDRQRGPIDASSRSTPKLGPRTATVEPTTSSKTW
jgi:hypothetical protein